MNELNVLNPDRVASNNFETRVAKDAVSVIRTILAIKPSDNRKKVQRQWAEACVLREELFKLVKALSKLNGLEIKEPESNHLPAHLSGKAAMDFCHNENRRWATALVEQLNSEKVGRWAWTGPDSLVYAYYTLKKRHGILKNKITRSRTQHEILKPRFRHIPVEMDMPALARKMQDLIKSASPKIRNSFGCIVGTLVAKGTIVTEVTEEDTAFAKTMNSAGGTVAAATAGIAAGAVGLASLALIDPAFVLGDICWTGWVPKS